MKKIVIMGGSFNPPTIAHYGLMKSALDALQAEKGIYVPVSYAYLKRKMVGNHSTFCLSENLRYRMLESMCGSDQRMTVSDIEYGLPNGRTYDTLTTIQQEYPDAQLYFLMGADKFELMHDFATKRNYFDHFYLAVFSREDVDAEEMILNDQILAPYAERFAFLDCPEEYVSVSSTAVHQAMEQGEDYSTYVHSGILKFLENVKMSDFPEEIIRFKGEYEFLSNLFPSPMEWEGVTYSCVEAAFQASKTEDIAIRRGFAKCKSDRIKTKGSGIKPSPQWEENQLYRMKELVRLKFQTYPELTERLNATRGKVLINGNKGNDSFWGTSLYSWDGENWLGKILMEVRDEL